ncbi:hypothetical protein Pyrde_0012 [Pyrodictium delaneyi]|uniref:Uncharacterized protein n=1 Tax=Pyrodictium delaneyi TaxID=1273541 RepID=A0A0P0N0W1_9CREN|nr:hypothetical protein [Pyrodictium delaneyi]ALL00062.1 hypothetical protein Pyrde_0012 [Pyrodictium delaneyi]OWJ55621.1 hypothetical protein Pdsh_02205 [Pyrodictium delaneyi]
MSWQSAVSNTWLGRILRGIVKLGLAGAIAAILGNINMDLSAVTIGSTTVDLSVMWDLVKVFAPLLLIISGLRDLGVEI